MPKALFLVLGAMSGELTVDERWKNHFSTVLTSVAELSYAKKLKVGAIAVRDNRVIVTGYNGRLPGEDNTCEYVEQTYDPCMMQKNEKLVTRIDVEHAELNLICYAARKGISLEGAALLITHSPCISCAKSIINAGFSEVYYQEVFSKREGLDFLIARSVPVRQLGTT